MKSMKKKAVSWLLTLAMLATYIPTALLPGAMATQQGNTITVKSFTWDKGTGDFSVILEGKTDKGAPASGSLVAWYLMVVPELKLNSDYSTPMEVLSAGDADAGSATTDKDIASAMANTGLAASSWAVPNGNGDMSWKDGQVKITGKLPTYTTLSAALNGKVDASGNNTYVSGNDIPFTFVFRSSGTTPVTFAYGALEESVPAQLTGVANPNPLINPDATVTITLSNAEGAADAVIVNTDENPIRISYDSTATGELYITSSPASGTIVSGGGSNTELTLGMYDDWDYIGTNGYIYVDIPWKSSGSDEIQILQVKVDLVYAGTATADPIVFTVKKGSSSVSATPSSATIKINNPDGYSLMTTLICSDGENYSWSSGEDDPTVSMYDLTVDFPVMDMSDVDDDGIYQGSVSCTDDLLTVSHKISINTSGWATTTAEVGTYTETLKIPYTNGSIDDLCEGNSVYAYLVVPITIEVIEDDTPPEITPINIRFSANGKTLTGSLPADYQSTPSTAGGSVSVSKPANVASTGYKFLGWATSASGTVINSWPQTVSADTTYYAQWEQQYRVTYNENKPAGSTVTGMPTSPSAYLDKGSNYTLVGTPSCTGATDGKAYKFKGWGATANATSTITSINNISKDETVYAIWEALPQVTFKIGTGGKFNDNTTADKVVNTDSTGKVTAPGVTANTGYTFTGWSDGTSTLTAAEVNGKNHTVNTTYTAQWELRKVASGTPNANNNLVEGATISLDKVTLSDSTEIAKANFGSADLANFEWYVVNSGVTPSASNTPVQSNNKTGEFTIPTGTAPTQHVWVKVKGNGTNISDEPCLIDMGPVGVESFTYEVVIHVNGSAPTTVPSGLTASLTTTNLEAGKSYGVTASVGGDSTDKYKFSGWSDSLTSGSSFNPSTGSVSVYSVPATTTGTGLVSKPGKNYIYANFVPIPHLTLTETSGSYKTGDVAYKGTVKNDGEATAYQVSYILTGGDADKFTVSPTAPTSSQLAKNGTDALTVTCSGTEDGKTYTTTLKITYSDAATGGVVKTIEQPVAFTYIEPTQTVHVVISVDNGTAQNSVTGITATPNASSKATLKKNETALLSTNTSDNGYRFTGWVDPANGSLSNKTSTNSGGTATYTMPSTVPSSAVTVTANYISVPYLSLAATTTGGHKIGNSSINNAVATVTNSGKAQATITTVKVDDDRFELANGSLAANGNVAASGTGTIKVAPKSSALAGLAAGTYYIPVTVTYKQVSTDAAVITLNTTVTYVVNEDTYKLTVVGYNGTGVTKVQYILNGGTATDYTEAIDVKNKDTVTLIATMASGYTATWAVTSNTCTAGLNSGTVLGLSAFTGNTTATLTATAAANLSLKPTPGSATKGDASSVVAPTMVISNSSTGVATITNIALSDITTGAAFTLAPATGTVGNDMTVTFTPTNGSTWNVGTYTAKVTVTYTDAAHGTTAQTASTYISFTVSAPSTYSGTVTVVWNNDSTAATVNANVDKVVVRPVNTATTAAGTEGTQTNNVWTFTGLSTSYDVYVETKNHGTIKSTYTLSQGNNVTVYLSLVSVVANGTNEGTVKLDKQASPLTKAYEAGTAVEIAATGTSPYKFDKWTKGDTTTPTTLGATATVLAEKTNTTYYAHFTQEFKLKYDGNGDGASNVPVDLDSYKTGAEAEVSATKPSRPGYAFQSWNTQSNGQGTTYNASTADTPVKVTMNSDVTLYAQWSNYAFVTDGYTKVEDSTTYGANYSTNAVATAVRNLNSNQPLKFSDATTGDTLASIGLSIDESGNISGRPFKVGTFTFSIKAEHANNASASATYAFELTVGKATPVISNVVVSGNQAGKTFADATYTYTVTAPKYVDDSTKWVDASELMKSTTAVSLPQTPTTGTYANAGTVAVNNPTTAFTTAAQSLTLTYTPNTATDGKSNAYKDIYENATTTLSVAGNAISEALVIDPSSHDFEKTATGKQFTVTNKGNVTTGAITITPPTGYQVTTALSKTVLAPGESATFTLTPTATDVGIHAGAVTASYTSGENTISASASVKYEVEQAATYDGFITVKVQNVGDSAAATTTLPTGYTVVLVDVKDSSKTISTTADANAATNGKYRYTGADRSASGYYIQVTRNVSGGQNNGSWIVPGKLVTYDTKTSQGFYLYEVKTVADSGTAPSGASTAGDGHYLAGIAVTITASPSSSGNVKFDTWKDKETNPTFTNTSATATYSIPIDPTTQLGAPVTLTAYWKDESRTSFTVEYDANLPTGVTANVMVPTPASVDSGNTHNIKTGTPTLPGYVFQYWTETVDSTTTNYLPSGATAPSGVTVVNAITNVTADHTLKAHWTDAAISGNDVTISATYGTGVSSKVAATSTDGGAIQYALKGSETLPGGLTLDENTGAITGIPYDICSSKEVTVVATLKNDNHADGSKIQKEIKVTVTVAPATPVITGVTATNVVTGAGVNTYDYVVTVAGPKYEVKDGTGSWTTAVDTLTYKGGTGSNAPTKDTTATDGGGIGTAAFTASGSDVKVDFTPAATDFDGKNQKQNEVWTTATKTVSVSADSDQVVLSVDPTEWNFDSNGNTAAGDHATEGYALGTDGSGLVKTTNTVHDKSFTLTNTGSKASGALTYRFASATADNTAGEYFTFAWTNASFANGLGTSSENNTGTFKVAVKSNTLKQGAYTDTLTITGANGGSAAVYRLVFVVDQAASYAATVTVKVKDVDGTATQGKMPSGFTAITLVPSDSNKSTVTLSETYWNDTNKNYNVTGLVTGVTYTVKTGDFVLGAVAVEGDNVDVELFQVQLAVKDNTPTGVTQTGAGYYAKGQGASISTSPSSGNYAFQEWADNATNPNKITTSSFTAVINDAVKYTATYTAALNLTYDLNDGTLPGTDPKPSSLTETHQAKDVVVLSECNATKSGYTFGGWNTKDDGTGVTYQPGANFSMPVLDTTLYAVWIENDTPVTAPSGSWTVAHKDSLSQTLTAGGGVGGYTYKVTGSGLPGTTNVTVTGGSSLAITAGTGGANYTKDGTNSGSMTVAVTDKNNTAAATNGTVTVTVVRAATEVTTPFDVANDYKPYEGDDLDFTKLSGAVVTVKKTDGTPNSSVDLDEAPTKADGTATDGTWKVVGTNPTTIGEGENAKPGIEYVLEFTPTDGGFLPCQTTVKVPTQKRVINTAEIGIFFPTNSGTPNTTVSGDNGKKIAATTTPTVTTPTDTFTVDNISWAPADKFDSKNDSTVYVQLTAGDGWEFSDSFAGTLTDQNTVSQGSKTGTDVKVIGNTGKTLTLMCVFKGEDQVVDDIYVETTAELKVDGTDSKLIGKAADALKYTVTEYRWEKTTGHEKVDNDHPFQADTLYDAVVKVEANEGYKFNTTNFSSAKGDDIKAHAFIDNGVPKEGDKTNKVEVAMSADGKSITIRFSAFKPVALKVVGIRLTEGELATTDYYAITATDKNADGDNIKTTADGVYGHSAHSAQYSNTFKTPIKYVLVYEDGSESTPIAYTNEKLVYGTSASGNLPEMPANGYTFTVEDPATKDDTAEYDGKNVYLSYTVGSNTYYAAKPVGTLTVRHLIADALAPSRVWSTAELTFVKGDSFKLPATNAPTASVAFNSGSSLANTTEGWEYAQTPNNGSNTHFYSTDVTSAAKAKEAELKAGATMADADNGKTVYMCYIDINGNLVYAPVGVLKVSGDTKLTVTAVNISDPTDNTDNGGSAAPEYGETLRADVTGKDGYEPTGKLTYEWQYKDENGEWKPIDDATDPTYTLTKDDVGREIRVEVKEQGTSGSATSNDPEGNPRTLSLDVVRVSKPYDGNTTNTHTYVTTSATVNDFTLSNVINSDEVYVSEYKGTKPVYGDSIVGSTFDWPAISDSTRDDYALDGAGYKRADGTVVYRLGDQATLSKRGEIVGGNNVVHVDVYLNGPANGKTPAANPVGVDSLTETTASNGGTQLTDFGLTWYEVTAGATFDVTSPGKAHTGAFGAAKTYAVVVPVKPAAGKEFNADTEFYFHIDSESRKQLVLGNTTGSGVYKDGDVYKMFYTFEPTKDSAVPVLTGISATPLSKTLYYMTTSSSKTPGHEENTRGNAPGDVNTVPFAFKTTGVTVTATTLTGDQSSSSAVNPTRFYVVDKSDNKVTLAAETTFTNDDYDGCEVYVEYSANGVTKDAYVGTLAIRELTAERITPTLNNVKLSYSVGDMNLDLSGVTGAKVDFNMDTAALKNDYSTTGRADAAGDVTKHYFELSADGQKFDAVKHGDTLTGNDSGKTLYICYKDVNEHIVRAAIGTLAVNSVDASTAAIRLENQDHANEHTQYGDELKVIPSGNSNGEMKYTWQVSADGTSNWTDLDATSMTDVTTDTWDALKNVGKYVRVVLTKDGDKTVPAGKIVSNVLEIKPKEITISYKWTTGSKVYDGTTTVPNFSTTVVYDEDDFKGQLVGDDVAHITPDHTAGAFENETVGTGKKIELTFGSDAKIKTDDATDHPISNYKVITVVEPIGAITDDEVTMVTVTYKEPVTGKTGDTNPDYADNTKVTVSDSTWYAKSTNAAPTAAADFVAGTALGTGTYQDSTFYLVTAKVSPKAGTGTKFDSTTKVTVNGVIVGVDGIMGKKQDASGKDIGWAVAKLENGGTITIKYIAQTETVDKEIIEITANVTAPSTSGTPASTVTTASATNKEPKDVKSVGLATTNPTVAWTGAMDSENKFAMDTAYTAEFIYEAKTADGYSFRVGDPSADPAVDPIKFTINGITVVGEGEKTENSTTVKTEKVSGSTDKYKVTVTFPETSGLESVLEVAVNYTVPAKGGHPAKSANYMPTDKVKLGTNEGPDALKYNDLVTDRTVGSTWFEGNSLPTSGNGLADTAEFGNGDYTVLAHFDAVDGNKFVSGANGTKFTVNGTEYPATSNHVTISSDGLTATVWHTFPGLDKEIVKVITAVTAPVAGAKPQATADTTVAANKNSTNLLPDALADGGKAAITWKTGSTTLGANATFDYSTAYTATFDVTTNTGYTYLDGDTTDVEWIVNSIVDASNKGINGAGTLTKDNVTVTTSTKTGESTTKYTVTITFPATEAKVDKLLTVNVNTTVPPEHKLRVPDVYIVTTEPYTNPGSLTTPATSDLVWKVKGSDGSWTVVAKDTPFEAGKEYMVEGKVVLKNPTTTTYTITGETDFYLGGVKIPQSSTDTTVAANAAGALTDSTGGKVGYTTHFEAVDKDGSPVTPKTGSDAYDKDTVFTVSLTFTALDDKTDPTIVKVAANVKQPIANQNIPTGTANLLLALNKDGVDMSDYVTASAVTWKEKAANGTFGTPSGDKFKAGGSYTAEFILTTDKDHPYVAVADPKDYLDLLINGVTHDNGKWLEGSTDEQTVGDADSINQIKVEIAPATTDSEATSYKVTVTFNNISDKADVLAVLGTAKEPKAHAAISTDDIVALDKQVYEKQSARWLDKDGNPITGDDAEFKPGNTYTAELTVKIKDSEKDYYRFKDTTTGMLNGSNETVVTRDPETGEPTTITLKLSFTVPKEEVKVHVAGTRPVAGDATVVTDTNKTINKANADEDRYDLSVVETVEGTDFYGKWYIDEKCTNLATKFEEGETYYMKVEVEPGDDYTLTTEPGDYTWDTNRQTANSVTKVDDKYVAVFEYTIRKAGEKAPNELAAVVTAPVAGKDVDKVGKPGNDNTTVVGDVKWTDGSGNTVSKFDYNTSYTATVVVQPKDPNNFDFDDPEFKLNGVEPKWTENKDEEGNSDGTYTLTYTFPPTAKKETITQPSSNTGSSGGSTTVELPQVFYKLGEVGVTDDLTAEKVRMNGKPAHVPKVEGLTITDGDSKKTYTFIGWSETDPAKTTGTPVLVDPTTFKISKDKTFYAVYEISGHTAIDHSHYVIGFPDGTFGPGADITRGEVATIIARACLSGFIEGANYGNPGGYSDVERHWAYSAISYCTMNSVFTGYTDGTFRPDQPITRQELATVVARLHGLIANQGVPFTDADQISKWAMDGVYTAYAKGWIRGYKDGSFKPQQNITRAETVKVFNGYLGRGVDAAGLEEMREYVHSGVASNNRENGYDEYMTWPDVPKTHWAYYEIIEAANDHTFYWLDETNPVPPEHWSSVWIDEVWRYHDNSSDGSRPTNPETDTPSY